MKTNKQIYTSIITEYEDTSDYLMKEKLSHEITVNEYYEQYYKLASTTIDKLVNFEQLLQLQYSFDSIEFDYYITQFDKVNHKINSIEHIRNDIQKSVISE